MSSSRASALNSDQASRRKQTAILTIGAIGVVFGDIGTSPLYAYREALTQASGGGITLAEIYGVLSLGGDRQICQLSDAGR
jgi:KUP system potassium uptake protein